jgi:CHAD domain-containing protein
LRADFKWLGDITTPTRDFDVYLLTYPDFESSLPESIRPDLAPLRRFLAEHQQLAQAQLVADLDSSRYAALIDRYRSWLGAPAFAPGATDPEVVPEADRPAAEFAATRTWKAYRGLVKDGRRIDADSPAEALHDLRKDAKKLRYALECFGSLFPADEIAPLVKELKGVQDVLGEFQDCEVQKGSLRGYGEALVGEVGPRSAPTLMAMGYLIEQLDERERVAREQFADRFEQFDRHHQRAQFRLLFAPPSEEHPS